MKLQLQTTITWELEDGTVEEVDFDATSIELMIEKLGAFERSFAKEQAIREDQIKDVIENASDTF
jgi:hypothetical protein